MALFQLMMLNTDWGVSGLHNIKLLAMQGVGYPVPHNFKWSGIINANFARPAPQLPIQYVRDRLYRGFCRSEAEFIQPTARFNDSREAIYALHRNQAGLEPHRLERMISDYDEFFEIVNNRRLMQSEILERCRPDTR